MAVGDDEFTVLKKTMRDLVHVQRRLVIGELHDLAERVRLVRDECYERVVRLGREKDL